MIMAGSRRVCMGCTSLKFATRGRLREASPFCGGADAGDKGDTAELALW